ncbi:MAG: hypothetical protein KAX49_19865 [Halanaerobiales bacterium]|nr:hypothetical protein [Halanaerobiales bacterium]
MKLQDICVSLELAQELKKAGYTQDSIFVLVKHGGVKNWFISPRVGWAESDWKYNNLEFIPAPTAVELSEVLPEDIKDHQLIMFKEDDYFYTEYFHWDKNTNAYETEGEKLPDSLAHMWILLKKESLM